MKRLAIFLFLCLVSIGCAPVSRSLQPTVDQGPRPPWIPMPNIDHPDIHYVTTVCYDQSSVEKGKECAWAEAERELGTRFHAFEEDMYVETLRGKSGESRYSVWLLTGVKREKSGPLPPEEIIPSEEPAPPPLPSVGSNPPVILWREAPPMSFSRGNATRGITFSYTATDDNGIARYQWRLDTRPIDTDQTGRKTFTDLTPGWHTFQVQAIDYQNSMSLPLIHRFEVRPNEQPTVRILSPGEGETVWGKELVVKLAGTDPDGQVMRYKASIGNVNNSQVSTSGEFTFHVASGAQRLFVQAEDEVGGLSDWVELSFVFEFVVDTLTQKSEGLSNSNEIGKPIIPGQIEVIKLPGNVELEMVYIPPGKFMMGSPVNEKGRDEDETLHQVKLTKGFWIGLFEVTQTQWFSMMKPYQPDFVMECGNCPVSQVSWEECKDFVEILNRQLANGGFRLPTEAEWEYACRAGKANPFSDDIYRIGWYDGNAWEKTRQVGQLKANAWGIYDMHGNVWEWCEDWYGAYPPKSVVDPLNSNAGSGRVYRGGSWNSISRRCRSANRDGGPPETKNRNLGFRLARDAQ